MSPRGASVLALPGAAPALEQACSSALEHCDRRRRRLRWSGLAAARWSAEAAEGGACVGAGLQHRVGALRSLKVALALSRACSSALERRGRRRRRLRRSRLAAARWSTAAAEGGACVGAGMQQRVGALRPPEAAPALERASSGALERRGRRRRRLRWSRLAAARRGTANAEGGARVRAGLQQRVGAPWPPKAVPALEQACSGA